jgi:hypothetical protein
MAYASLSEAVKSTAFAGLSPEAKQVVFDKYSKDDSAYNGLSTEAKQHVQETYLGKQEEPKEPEKSIINKGTEAVFGKGPEATMDPMERIKRVGEAGVIGMGTGGAIGGGVGALAGGIGAVPGAAVGATTGFVAGVLGEVAEQTAANLGYGRAAQVLAGITASGPAEIVKEALPTMFRNLMPKKALIEGVLNRFKSESTLQAEKTAVLEAGQKKQFGPKTAGWEEGVDLGKNAAETQTRLQKEHKFGETRGYTATGATTEETVKPSTALATGKEDLSAPMLGNKPAPARTQKLEPIPPREAKIDPKTKQPQKVSEVLRNEMYDEVGKLTVKNPSQRFSSSEQFKILSAKLDEHVAEGTISKADKNHLLTILKSDEGSVGSQQRYGKTVDNQIRGWAGKPGAEGKTALTQQQRNAVRNDLRNSFAEWTDKQGFGQIEKDYRSAFTQEKIAEAKDYIPRLVSDYDGKPQATQFARQMINDTPEAKNLLTQELNTHFANIKAKDIPSEFNRIRKLLVNTDIMKPEELTYLRQQVEAVEKGGDPEAIGARMKRIINRNLKVNLPASAARSGIMGQTTDNSQ